MENYKLKQKIIKTKPVTYFRATNQNATQHYIVKKLNKAHTWQQVLQSKSLTLCKNTKCKYIARIKEIIKQENSFYCIMDNSQTNLTQIIRNDIQRKDIYKISRQLVQLMLALNEQKIMIRDIRPSHLFISSTRNNLKLYHFQSFSEKDITELDLTELQDMRYLAPEQVLIKKGFDQRSLVFSIGLIICQLIIGEPLLNAKNKLQYIYQITHLFPNDRMDKMKGSQHEFKAIQQKNSISFSQKMLSHSQLSPQFVSFLERMLKIDYSQRLSMNQAFDAFNAAIQNEQNFHKNKQIINNQNNHKYKPNKNQVNMETKDIQFQFQNKPTLSIIPAIFSQKQKLSRALPLQQNIQDDGNQPIIIKQASSLKSKQLGTHLPLKKGTILKANQPTQFSSNIVLNNLKSQSSPQGSAYMNFTNPNINSNKFISPISNTGFINSNMQNLGILNVLNRNNQIKNSRSTKQTTTMNTNTIKKPQLTNYAMNQVNLGIKLGMNNTLFSQNNDDHQFI